MGPRKVLVEPASYFARNQRLFAALEALYPIMFLAASEPDQDADGAVLIGTTRAEAESRAGRGIHCLLLPSDHGLEDRRGLRHIHFGDADMIPPLLRGRHLSERRARTSAGETRPISGDVLVASHNDVPLWIRRTGAAGVGTLDLTSIALPMLAPSSALSEHLNRDQFMGILPILCFIQELTGDIGWSVPGLRACLVLDDVNLRRGSYGCIDFHALARSARAHNYHASVALIPLDAGRVGRNAAAIFRRNPQHLSILIHGNNHINFELARDYSAAEQLAILAEARRRMLGLTNRLQLPVCPIAEPPYGVLGGSFLPALIALGYEAALCTVRHYLKYNPTSAASLAFGLHAAESLPGGLAMIPRIPAMAGWETEAVLAAFLGQPIAIAGHHFDADDNLRLIEEVVDYISGLGQVAWCSPSSIASSQYLWRRDGSRLCVRTCSRRVAVTLPHGIETVIVERPWLAEGDAETLHWETADQVGTIPKCGPSSEPIQVAGGVLTIVSPPSKPVDPREVPSPSVTPWAIVRRTLAEGRDRLYPYFPSRYRRLSQLAGPRD
jgi:hypothetical protein